jgi:hypothetical protein
MESHEAAFKRILHSVNGVDHDEMPHQEPRNEYVYQTITYASKEEQRADSRRVFDMTVELGKFYTGSGAATDGLTTTIIVGEKL